jgi:hypothetical protein
MVLTGFASKPVVTVFAGLASKLVATVSYGLALKPVAMVSSSMTSKPAATVFSSLASKLVATVSAGFASKPAVGFLVEPQNQDDWGFPSLGLKTDSSGLVILASKSLRRFLLWALKPSGLWFVGCTTKPVEGGQRRTRIEI